MTFAPCRSRFGRGGRRLHVDGAAVELSAAIRHHLQLQRQVRRDLWVEPDRIRIVEARLVCAMSRSVA